MPALLQTKLFLPTAPPNLVLRSRLVQLLGREGLDRLTLISAPAGFGKTTLVVTWLQQHVGPTAWLGLDEHDNQLRRFLTYVIAAVQTIEPALGSRAQSILETAQVDDALPPLTALINDLSTYSKPITLVLDDYHVISAQPIHDAVLFLLDHAPANMRLIMTTRHDPPLPLARWRVRNQLTEVRADDLRFTAEEGALFLNERMGLNLSADAIATLEQRAEGWIAALQLAALSLRHQTDTVSFIESFRGDNRFIADYLLEEVLRRQSPDVRFFLLCTSVLQRFNADLCHALLADLEPANISAEAVPTVDYQALIEQLDAANLFVVPLDHQRQWYRYHQLFADLLRYRLRREYPHLWQTLHIRASEWHEQAQDLDEAMAYTLAIHDTERACAFVRHYGMWLLRDGFISTVLAWIEPLPDARLYEDALLCSIAALAHLVTRQFDRAKAFIDAGEQQINGYTPVVLYNEEQLFSRQELQAHFAGYRALLAQALGQSEQVVALAQQALAQLPPHATAMRALLCFTIGNTYYQHGAVELAQDSLRQAANHALQLHQNTFVATTALSMLGTILHEQGHLSEAVNVYRESIDAGTHSTTGQLLPPVIYPSLNLGWIYYRWNDLSTSEHYLQQAETLAQQGGLYDPLIWVYLLRARRETYTGQFSQATQWIEHAASVIESSDGLDSNWFDVAIARAQLALRQGQLAEAEQHLQQSGGSFTGFREHQAHSSAGYQFFVRHQSFYPTLAQLLVEQQQLSLAHELLRWQETFAARTHYIVVAAQTAILQAIAYHAQQQHASAQDALNRALDLAAPRNLQRVILEYGSSIAPLLLRVLPTSVHASFIQKLLATPELADASPPVPRSATLPESLTERETQILRLLVAGLNSMEVAQQLMIAPSTVRTYIKSLYSKLDVNRRHDAVAKARELQLI